MQKVLASMVWYTFSDVLRKCVVFFTTPIFSRLLTEIEFGSFANYLSWYSLIGVFATLNVQASLGRARFDFKDNLGSFIASILILSSLSTLLSFLILINSTVFLKIFSLDKKYLFIMFTVFLVSPAYEVFLLMQRFQYKYKVLSVLSISTITISSSISLILIIAMKDRLLARVLGSVFPIFFISCFLYISYLYSCFHIRLHYWWYSIVVCVPYCFSMLSSNVLNQSDRIMITSICGVNDTALYSIAYTIAQVIMIFAVSMNTSFSPWLGEKLISKQYHSIKKHTHGYISMFSIIIVSFMLIAPEAMLFLGGKRYLEAKYAIPPVMVGCYFIFLYYMYVNVEQFEKKTVPMAIATFLAALSNLLLNYIFIPIYGYIAAAYTTLFCYFLLWLFHYFLVRRMGLHIIYDTKFIVLVSVAVCAVMVLSLWLYQMTVIRYIVLICYVGALGYIGLKNKEKIMVYFGGKKCQGEN